MLHKPDSQTWVWEPIINNFNKGVPTLPTCKTATSMATEATNSNYLHLLAAASQTTETEKSRFIDDIYELVTRFGGYVASRCMFEEKRCLIISHENLFNHPLFGMISRCRISVTEGQYIVHVMMREVERGSLEQSSTDKVLYLCNKYATNSSVNKFCPGIDPVEYEKQREIIRFDLKCSEVVGAIFAHRFSELFNLV